MVFTRFSGHTDSLMHSHTHSLMYRPEYSMPPQRFSMVTEAQKVK